MPIRPKNRKKTRNLLFGKWTYQEIIKWFLKEIVLPVLLIIVSVYIGIQFDRSNQGKKDQKEIREVMSLITSDLGEDTLFFQKGIDSINLVWWRVNAMMSLYRSDRLKDHIDSIYFYARNISKINTRVYPITHTFEYIKYGGLLRLISDTMVLSSLTNYYNYAQRIAAENLVLLERVKEYAISAGKIFNAAVMFDEAKSPGYVIGREVETINTNQIDVNNFFSNAQYYGIANQGHKVQIDSAGKLARKLIYLIKKVYKL